jgi:hypothetical protein
MGQGAQKGPADPPAHFSSSAAKTGKTVRNERFSAAGGAEALITNRRSTKYSRALSDLTKNTLQGKIKSETNERNRD